MRDFNSDTFEKQIVFKNINFIKVTNSGRDFLKYKIGLKNNTNPSESIILMNDSFVFIRNIGDIVHNIRIKINKGAKFIGFSESDMGRKHYQGWFWVLNRNLISDYYRLLTNDKLDTSKGSNNVIQQCEIGISNYFINKYNSKSIYHTNSDNLLLEPLEKLICKGYPVVKLQCLRRAKYGNKKITDFKPEIYKKLQHDLKHLSNRQAQHHFFTHGIKEGRKYKYNQRSFIPPTIKLALDRCGLLVTDFV